jgi:GWxTD domain-containing protein
MRSPLISMKTSLLLTIATVMFALTCAGMSAGAEMRGEGDFEFYVTVAPLPYPGRETLELVQIAIPSKEVLFVENEGEYEASIEVYISFKSEDGTLRERGFVLVDRRESPPRAKDISEFIYIADSSFVDPGFHTFEVRIKDLNGRKKTLVGLLRGQYLSSELKDVYIDVPRFASDQFVLSEPVLAWSMQKDGGFVPNPMGIYGLRNDSLSFFIKAQVPDGVQADSIDLYINIIDQAGELYAETRSSLSTEERAPVFFVTFDLNSFPASSYRINAVAFCGAMRASRGKDFSVSWELINWQKPMRDLLTEARILLPDENFDQFQNWSIGEQESYLNAYWKKIDPTPHTAVNETYNEFMHRLYYADANFEGFRRGAVSDRGLIFIRFGQPDEIVQQAVPFNRGDVSEALKQLEDKYKVITHETFKDGIVASHTQIIMEGKSSPFRGEGFDTGGYELWVYNIKGDPIFERDKLMTIQSGLRFLFVDKDGVGEYKLVGTSEEYMKEN